MLYKLILFPIPNIIPYKGRINEKYNVIVYYDECGTVYKENGWNWYTSLDDAKTKAQLHYSRVVERKTKELERFKECYKQNIAPLA